MTLADLESPKKRPLIATIVADGGLGKTTLGSLFPSPVFIRLEDGIKSIEDKKHVALFPLAQASQDAWSAVSTLLSETHKFKTVVIDSVTRLNVMLEAEVVASDPKAKSINQAEGGYGAGYSRVASLHGAFRELCGRLCHEKDMNVIFLAHAENETVDLPDQDSYTRYTIRMNKRSVQHYSDNVDLVGFIKLRQFTSDGKASTTGERIITCYPTPSHISKNRFGITEDLPFTLEANPFERYL